MPGCICLLYTSPDQQGRILLKVCNGYAEPEYDDHYVQEGAGIFFSYPGYYKMIVDSVGIFNGVNCLNKRRMLREERFDELITALRDKERQFPIIVILSKETPDGMMDEEWLAPFRVSDFTRTVWRLSLIHI